ncbi:bifunctional UDP-sugar hydrolase/5'-nucleotidase [Alisedimentitalea sp. MJ-SS2]|uniref:bifunctional metallophosphatase/5'-nucleotidase n=1 Tax=Aliisedimentitalea sp. MJ-SS2 TaxID=3049795 RepID=UPI0029134C69|nr:bifunctional UDP-sugar hydrolase/5'-nucleotidase [Alisedimentitalea sp. MJ-SS2]MDU8928907.1 bifunctional UDP-sugar hydrolase/5'-nucleotidase [Alisedimentitalea sp. MJ-SS2]
MRRFTRSLLLLTAILFGFAPALLAETQKLTIVHSNDLHSHVLGFSPNSDYTPNTVNDDATLGGWARIATIIKTAKASRDNPVLVLDAGDFLMGSLFHTISRQQASELVLLKEMGVEVTTLGNHEFDLTPDGLARILRVAIGKAAMPEIVASNLIFDPADPRDDSLQAHVTNGLIKPYTVIEKDGLRVGIFGLVGKDADFAAPFASPVSFGDPIETAKAMVAKLRTDEAVDIVICLSHSGLDDNPKKSEDLLLAQAVDGLDLIISGHTDTVLPEPIVENNTIIVHAYIYGQRLGVLDLDITDKGIALAGYTYTTVDDAIPGDPDITALVEGAKQMVTAQTLAPLGLSFDQPVVETGFDLLIHENEAALGNLVTDATRWAADRAEHDPADPHSRVRLALHSNGGIRDHIIAGKTGQITVADLFRVVPLGIGSDGSIGYPLVSVYMTGPEIKKMFEVLTTLPHLKGDYYYLHASGAKVTYNPNRMLFDRVTAIALDDGEGRFVPLDYSPSNTETYKVVASLYHATFLKVIGSFTQGILTIVPKDANNQPIDDLDTALIDADPTTAGLQEVKEWAALIEYVQTFPDTNANGLPNMPERYAALEGRQVIVDSLNPIKLVSGGNYLTWAAVGLLVLGVGLVALMIYLPIRIIRKRRRLA